MVDDRCPECGVFKRRIKRRVGLLCLSCNNKLFPNNWKGGKTISSRGYMMILDRLHPRNHGGYIAEHVLVAEKKIGRYLTSEECVHHINGEKLDNRPENTSPLR